MYNSKTGSLTIMVHGTFLLTVKKLIYPTMILISSALALYMQRSYAKIHT